MKCDIFQGYYFGKPVAKNTFEKLFLARSFDYKGLSVM
jgi:EAL domain-containing protein (putative c-di-GMP-specific phosphodiesterase class I)